MKEETFPLSNFAYPADTEGLPRDATGVKRLGHAVVIRRHNGYLDFHKGAEASASWLAKRDRISAEPPGALFNLASASLVESTVLLPVATVQARLVAQVSRRDHHQGQRPDG